MVVKLVAWCASARGSEGENLVVAAAGVDMRVVGGAFLLAGDTRGFSGPGCDNCGRLLRLPALVSLRR